MTGFWVAVGALVPSLGVGLIFWYVMRSVIQADRRERDALAVIEAEEDRAARNGAAAADS